MSKEKWKDVRNDKGNAVLDCTERGWNGAMCAKTTKRNGGQRVRRWRNLPECVMFLYGGVCEDHYVTSPIKGVTKPGLIISDSVFLTAEGRYIITVHKPIHAGTVSFVVQKDFKDYKSPVEGRIHKPVLTDFGTHRRYWTALSNTKCSFLFFFNSEKGSHSLSMQCI